MPAIVTLHNWSTTRVNIYRSPEIEPVSLVGDVYGHPTRPDGRNVTTSQVKTVDGRIITTRSGSLYRLGRINPAFRKWLREHRPKWDWRNPITIKERA